MTIKDHAHRPSPPPHYSQVSPGEIPPKGGGVPAYAWSGEMVSNGWPNTPPTHEGATTIVLGGRSRQSR